MRDRLGAAASKPTPGILLKIAGRRGMVRRRTTQTTRPGQGRRRVGRADVARVRPPENAFKDWTEAHQGGVNLCRWWSDRLGGNERPSLFTWEELSARRWGPALDDPKPGLVIDHPGPASGAKPLWRPLDPTDAYAVVERRAIQSDGA